MNSKTIQKEIKSLRSEIESLEKDTDKLTALRHERSSLAVSLRQQVRAGTATLDDLTRAEGQHVAASSLLQQHLDEIADLREKLAQLEGDHSEASLREEIAEQTAEYNRFTDLARATLTAAEQALIEAAAVVDCAGRAAQYARSAAEEAARQLAARAVGLPDPYSNDHMRFRELLQRKLREAAPDRPISLHESLVMWPERGTGWPALPREVPHFTPITVEQLEAQAAIEAGGI